MNRSEQLEAIKRELQRQDREWALARERLRRLGHIELAVPSGALEAIDAATLIAPIHPTGAVRA